jgi:hypothetical protein
MSKQGKSVLQTKCAGKTRKGQAQGAAPAVEAEAPEPTLAGEQSLLTYAPLRFGFSEAALQLRRYCRESHHLQDGGPVLCTKSVQEVLERIGRRCGGPMYEVAAHFLTDQSVLRFIAEPPKRGYGFGFHLEVTDFSLVRETWKLPEGQPFDSKTQMVRSRVRELPLAGSRIHVVGEIRDGGEVVMFDPCAGIDGRPERRCPKAS